MKTRLGLVLVFGTFLVSACSSQGSTASPEQTGSACTSAAACFPDVADAGSLRGAPLCRDRVTGGYCTHTCTTDADCCAVPGECRSGFPQVCAPFESTGQMMCFLSCEKAIIDGGDGASYCAGNGNSAFSCKSSGGGGANRKVCVP